MGLGRWLSGKSTCFASMRKCLNSQHRGKKPRGSAHVTVTPAGWGSETGGWLGFAGCHQNFRFNNMLFQINKDENNRAEHTVSSSSLYAHSQMHICACKYNTHTCTQMHTHTPVTHRQTHLHEHICACIQHTHTYTHTLLCQSMSIA